MPRISRPAGHGGGGGSNARDWPGIRSVRGRPFSCHFVMPPLDVAVSGRVGTVAGGDRSRDAAVGPSVAATVTKPSTETGVQNGAAVPPSRKCSAGDGAQ